MTCPDPPKPTFVIFGDTKIHKTNQENPCLEEQNDSTISEEIEDEDLQSIEKGIRELDVPDKDETDDELPTQSNSNETNVSNSKTNKEVVSKLFKTDQQRIQKLL